MQIPVNIWTEDHIDYGHQFSNVAILTKKLWKDQLGDNKLVILHDTQKSMSCGVYTMLHWNFLLKCKRKIKTSLLKLVSYARHNSKCQLCCAFKKLFYRHIFWYTWKKTMTNKKVKKLKHTDICKIKNMNISSPKWTIISHIEYSFHLFIRYCIQRPLLT